MLSLFWTRTSAAAPIVSVSRYRKDLQLSPGNGNVSIFALVPVPCLSGASLTPFPPEVAACSARVERFTLSSGPPLPEERSRFFRHPYLVVVVVVVVSHIQHIGCQPEKTTLHGGQSRSWSAEQGKENKRKSLAAYPPHPPHCSFGENK